MATNVAMYRALRTDFPAAPRRTSAPELAAVPVEGRHSDQGGDLPAVQTPQLGQLSHDHARHHVSDSGNAGEQIVFGSPHRAGPDELLDLTGDLSSSFDHPGDVRLDVGSKYGGACRAGCVLR